MVGTEVIASVLSPGGFIAWIIIGLIAGWLAGRVMSGEGYGIIGDIVVGLIGALIGGIIVGALTSKTFGFIGSIVVAFIGACVLVGLLRVIKGESIRA